jgi:hypothetical protein
MILREKKAVAGPKGFKPGAKSPKRFEKLPRRSGGRSP